MVLPRTLALCVLVPFVLFTAWVFATGGGPGGVIATLCTGSIAPVTYLAVRGDASEDA